MKVRRLAVLLALLAPLLAACAVPPSDSRPVALASRDFGFIDELGQAGAGRAREVDGRFFLPPTGSAPYPAVVLLHSSIGQGTQDWRTAEVLRARGFAVLAIDSFGPRGVEKTIKDQTLVSEASMVADAYAGLVALSADPRIDGGRIAVMGFSKGGIAALYAGLETVRARMGARMDVGARRFAAHVAYYPWCGVGFLDQRTTGAPILIELGALDEVAPPALCQAFAGEVRQADPAARLVLSVQAAARHAFDHPLLDWFESLPVGGVVPVDCRFREVSPGRFIETHSNEPASGKSLKALIEACGRDGLSAGGNPQAAQRALAETLGFLEDALARP